MKNFKWFIIFLPIILLSSFKLNDKQKEDHKIRLVVIDAGHGGKDPGCHGVSAKEKTVALAVALKVGEYITKYIPDVKVMYTRTTDEFIELHERAGIANRNKADAFISIHCNASKSNAHGTETFTMGMHKTNENLDVAKRENSVILLEENYEENYSGFDPSSVESYIFLNLQQKAFHSQSILLADQIQNEFKEKANRFDRGVKQAGYLVLYKTSMPAVLVEIGFLTNKEEEKFLTSPTGSELIASGVYRAFKNFKAKVDPK